MPTGTSGSVLVVIVGPPSLAGTRTDVTNYGRAPSYRLTESSHCHIEPRGGNGVIGNDTKRTRAQAESGWPCETKRSNAGLKPGVGRFVPFRRATCGGCKRNSTRLGGAAVKSTFENRGATVT